MEVSPEQIVEALNHRAATDPLVKELLRSTMFEIAYGLLLESEKGLEAEGDNA